MGVRASLAADQRPFGTSASEVVSEPRWEELTSALREEAVIADDAALLALPFVIEVDDPVSARLNR